MPNGKQLDVVDIQSNLPSYQLAVLRGDHISIGITSTRRPYEEFLLRVVVALTRRGDRVLDVGANIGNHTIYWAEAGLNVISFEPNPEVRFVLERNVEMNDLRKQVDVKPFALGRAPLRGVLNPLIEGNQGAVAVDEDEGGDIEIAPLDSLGIGRVSLVKIDVEGHEADVVSGGRNTLMQSRPFVIAEARAGTDEVAKILREIGYRRLPLSLASTDTYLYAPTRRSLLLLRRDRSLWRELISRGIYSMERSAYRALPASVRSTVRGWRGRISHRSEAPR